MKYSASVNRHVNVGENILANPHTSSAVLDTPAEQGKILVRIRLAFLYVVDL